MVIEPKIGVGGGGFSSNPTYRSTSAQAPFNGSASRNNGQACGGASFWWPSSGGGAVKIAVDVLACSGPSAFGDGDDTLFRIRRHGASGDVDLRARINAIAVLPVAIGQRSFGRLPVHRDRQHRKHNRLQRDVEFQRPDRHDALIVG